jgi:hypothetical protein
MLGGGIDRRKGGSVALKLWRREYCRNYADKALADAIASLPSDQSDSAAMASASCN